MDRSNSEKIDRFIEKMEEEFSRISDILRIKASIKQKIIENVLWITFSDEKQTKSLNVPLPETGFIKLLHVNEIDRVLNDFWLEKEQTRLDYCEIVARILIGKISSVFPYVESDKSMLWKVVESFSSNNLVYTVSQLQRLINDLISSFPLYETDMNAWVMNKRLIIIDPDFDSIRDPGERLEYQVNKNKKYYEKFGWTSIGLSDGTLADKNVILDLDLRKHTPFGQYHNPQRNLYSTLGMQGDELPKFRTKSSQELVEKGISRKGWHLNTAIIDLPMNFEDQIIVDNKHRGKFHTIERKFSLYSNHLYVGVGDKVETGDPLGASDDGTVLRMTMKCDESVVTKIRKELTNVGGEVSEVNIITIKGKRYLKDGSKLSNLHSNKGVIRFADLGTWRNPSNGKEERIDLIISGKSINKRANFGQILEILADHVHPENEPIVMNDDYFTSKVEVKKALNKAGFPEDGTCVITTPWGEFVAIVGKMFWGVTKDPEDQIWDEEKTFITNNKELRTSGLKFSHVEFKALVTRFGPENPIIEEIFAHTQGAEIIQDEIKILESIEGKFDEALPIVDTKSIKSIDSTKGIFHNPQEVEGTIMDENLMPDGFILKLPTKFQVTSKINGNLEETFVNVPQTTNNSPDVTTFVLDKIFVPTALLRRCWRHQAGRLGMSQIGAYLNRIVDLSNKFTDTSNVNFLVSLMQAIRSYFINVARIMATKTGDLSTYGMAIRYPKSSHAVATLSNELPDNTIEIHENMANELDVKTGDVVLAERFPCLGFMSIRPQFVKVTNDPQCKYTIRVSNNSLVSMNLDFDGDTLFIASFHSPAAKLALTKEMENPNKICKSIIDKMNSKKIPITKERTLDEFEIKRFIEPTVDEHAELVRKATGVKSHTGPVIALAYNLMRIVERNISYKNIEEHAHVEVLLDFLGNTVFKQKHGIKSLQEEATDAICTADLEKMVSLGFDKKPSLLLCNLIVKEAASLGIVGRNALISYHEFVKANGRSKIINRIVREKNKVYFATRASFGPRVLLHHLKESPVDLPSFMLNRILKSERMAVEEKFQTILTEKYERQFRRTNPTLVPIYKSFSKLIDTILLKKTVSNTA
jgi:hypothetical protein